MTPLRAADVDGAGSRASSSGSTGGRASNGGRPEIATTSGGDADGADERFAGPRPPGEQRRLHVVHVTGTASEAVAAPLLDCVRDQVDRGWTVTLVCPSRGTVGYAARDLGARVRWWSPREDDRSRWVESMVAGVRLRRALDRVTPDVAHLHGRRAGLVGRLVLRGRLPILYEPHGQDTPEPDRRAQRPTSCERLAARWTAQIVCADADEAEQLRARSSRRPVGRGEASGHPGGHPGGHPAGHPGEIAVVGRGVDVTRWRPQGPQDRSIARAVLDLPDDDPVVLGAGPIHPGSVLDELASAWPGVRRAAPAARLALVGDATSRAGSELCDAPGVRVVGPRHDLAVWLAAADVVVASGPDAPVVALRAMSSARVVLPVLTAGDRRGLVPAVLERLADPGLTDDEGWRGRRLVEAEHDCVEVAREVARLYPRLVAARR